MPSTIKIKVVEARGLPIMDARSKLADAYVEVRVDQHPQQTHPYVHLARTCRPSVSERQQFFQRSTAGVILWRNLPGKPNHCTVSNVFICFIRVGEGVVRKLCNA